MFISGAYIHNEHNGVTNNVKALSKGTMVTTEMVQEEGKQESCACGDIFDEQLQRCFVMTPEIFCGLGDVLKSQASLSLILRLD